MITYGAFTPAEYRAVQRIWLSMDDLLGRGPLRIQIAPENTDVGRYNHRPIGFCYYRHGLRNAHTTIQAIAVLPMFRKHGVARGLIQRLAAASPHPVIVLKVEADNPAVAFYRRLGFVEIGREDARTGRAMIVMQGSTATLRPTDHEGTT